MWEVPTVVVYGLVAVAFVTVGIAALRGLRRRGVIEGWKKKTP